MYGVLIVFRQVREYSLKVVFHTCFAYNLTFAGKLCSSLMLMWAQYCVAWTWWESGTALAQSTKFADGRIDLEGYDKRTGFWDYVIVCLWLVLPFLAH